MADITKKKYVDSVALKHLLEKLRDKNKDLFLGKMAEAASAAKVKNALTLTVGDTDVAFDGSEAKSAAVAAKSHTHVAKDISDFTAAVKKAAFGDETASMTAHTHDNKGALDKISDDRITAWDAKIAVGDVEKIVYTNAGVGGTTNVKNALDILVANVQIAAGQLTATTKNMDAVKKIADDAAKAAAAEVTRAEKAENDLQTAINDLLNADKEGSLAKQVADNKAAIEQEVKDRTAADTTLQGNIDAEANRAKAAESANATAIANEVTAREQADTTLDGKITTEKERAEAVEQGLRTDVDANKSAIEKLNGGEEVVGSVANAVAIEKTRAMGVEGGLRTDVDKAQSDVDALAGKVGTVPDDKTVVEMIADAITESTYDDIQVKADIAKNAGAIAAIQADYLKAADKTALEGKISEAQKAADDAQKAADAAQADIDAFFAAAETGEAAIDTLKEIQNYITTHGEAASEMVTSIGNNKTAIEANKTAIDAINNETTGILAQAKKYAEDQDAAQKEALEGAIATAKSEAITAAGTDATSKVDAAKTELQGKIDLKADTSALQDEITRATGVENGLQTAINTLNAGSTTQGSVDYKIAQAKATIDGSIQGLDTRLTTAEGEIDTLQATVAKLDGAVDVEGSVKKQIKDAIDPVAGRVTTAEEKITALETKVGDAESGLVKDVADLKTTVGDASAGLVKEVADLKAKDTALDGEIEALKAKDTALVNEDTRLAGLINTNAADIATNTGDIANLQAWTAAHGELTTEDIDAMLDQVYNQA